MSNDRRTRLRRVASPRDTDLPSSTIDASFDDVAARLELEQARLAATFSSLLDPYVILCPIRDRRGRITNFQYVEANEAAVDYVNTTRERLIGAKLLDLLPGPASLDLFQKYVSTFESGERLVLEDCVNGDASAGVQRRYSLCAVKVGDTVGLSWRDVTEKSDTLDQFRLLAENASDIVLRAQSDGRLMWISPSVESELGWTPGDLIGTRVRDLAHPDDGELIAKFTAELTSNGYGTMESRIRASDHSYRYYEVNAHHVFGPDGDVETIVASLRRIDSEVATREAWRVERDILRATMRAELDPHVIMRAVLDDGGRIVDFEYVEVNEAAIAFNETTREQLTGARFLDLSPGHVDSGLFDYFVRTLESGEPLALDGFFYHDEVNDADRHFDVRAVKVGDLLSNTWRDVSQSHATLNQYRLLAENAADVVFEVGVDFVIKWVSPSVTHLFGFDPSEVIGQSMTDVVHPDDIVAILATIELTGPNERNSTEARVLNISGDYQWVSIFGRIMADELGVTIGYIGSVRDARQDHANREALVESEERYRLLAENSSDVVVVHDGHEQFEWVSESVKDLLGWRPDQLIGRPILDYVHADDVTTVRAAWRALQETHAETFEARYRRTDNSYHWVSAAVREIRQDGDDGYLRIASWRDVQDEVEARHLLAESEDRFRLLAENASDIIYETDAEGFIKWISPSVRQELGWLPSDLVGMDGTALIFDDDVERMKVWRAMAQVGDKVQQHETRYRSADGEVIWMSVQAHPIRDERGVTTAIVVALRNCQSEVQTRRALTTLSAGSRSLVRAEHELDLLTQMCQVAVDEGGYRFAWYGRKVDDVDHTVEKVTSSEAHRNYLSRIQVTWGGGTLGQGPVGRAIRDGDTVVSQDLRSDVRMSPWVEAALHEGLRSAIGLPVRVGEEIDGAFMVYAPEPGAFDDAAVSLLEDLAAELGFGLKRLRDRELLMKSLNAQTLLTRAIDQAGEAIVVSDPSSNIIYANPAALRTSGYTLDELMGENPRIFQSGLQPHAFYEDMWAQLLEGQTWRGVLLNRNKEGDLYEEDATISPIHDADGTTIAYVAVKHDFATQRRLEGLEQDLSRVQDDRHAIVNVMRNVRVADNVHATAGLFCEAATQLPHVDVACVLLIEATGSLLPIAMSGSAIFDVTLGESFRPYNDESLQRVERGSVLLSLDPDDWPANPQIAHRALAEGIVALVLAPVRWEDRLIGVLALGTRDPLAAQAVPTRLTYFEELGSYAGSLFGAQANAHANRTALSREIRDVIDNHRFRSVFQPFVDLFSGHVVGYEALTRFDDGRSPELRFIEAQSVGLGSELEALCVTAAFEVAHELGPEEFLSVNFSPAALLDGSAAKALRGRSRRTVIEVTEHAQIDNYAAVRSAVDDIGCKLAVDDAGAGYTSLRHILELRPEYVKLDISIVRNIDSSPERQAMAAGMCHYAEQAGTIIIAEGIESEAEAEALRNLGVTLGKGGILGQGYHFAKPGPLDSVGRG